jgi:hypothetical protein
VERQADSTCCNSATLKNAGVAAEGSLPEREFSYYPRLTAMSTMYPDEADAAQVSTGHPPLPTQLPAITVSHLTRAVAVAGVQRSAQTLTHLWHASNEWVTKQQGLITAW